MTYGKELYIRKILTDIKISDGKRELLLSFSDNTQRVVGTFADCCSDTWIEHVNILATLPSMIYDIGALDLNIPDSWEEVGHECVRFYGHKIVTASGDIVIDYRNSSNGYYGGSLSFNADIDPSTVLWKDLEE